MEECEALCTRLAIMVNGKFKCLGSIQHLKNKYGDGYTFCLRLKGPDYERAQRQAQRFVDQNFPEAIIKECHYNILQFEMKCRNISLSYVFSKMESAQKDLSIEDYSVSQNTLDNVSIYGKYCQSTTLIKYRNLNSPPLTTFVICSCLLMFLGSLYSYICRVC